MKFLIELITAKYFFDFWNWLKKTFRPPSAFSWETLILLSLFSWYMSWLANNIEPDGFVANLLINFAWIFLILGVFWGTTAANQFRIGYKYPTNPGFPLSPWITGAIVSLYIFGRSGEVPREALIYWPIISAIIAVIPDFWGDGFRLKSPPLNKRQNIVVLFCTQILLSCWFQFYFVVQDWLVQYPSLLADNFNQSAFVVKRDSAQSVTPRGALLLNALEPKLTQQLDGKPWPQVERSLLKGQREKLINTLEKQSKRQIKEVEEDELWKVTSNVSSRASGYNLDLRANWQGPRANPQRSQAYSLTKSCQITQVSPRTGPATKPINAKLSAQATPISRFQCAPVKGWGVEEPGTRNRSFIKI